MAIWSSGAATSASIEPKCSADDAGGRGADVMDAQPGQHARQAAAFGVLDAGEQVVGLLFAHAFEREHGVALVGAA